MFFLLYFMQHYSEKDPKKEKRKRNRSRWALLDREERQKRTRAVPRPALADPHKLPWARLYASRSMCGMITVTGYDYDKFQELLQDFGPLFHSYTPF